VELEEDAFTGNGPTETTLSDSVVEKSVPVMIMESGV